MRDYWYQTLRRSYGGDKLQIFVKTLTGTTITSSADPRVVASLPFKSSDAAWVQHAAAKAPTFSSADGHLDASPNSSPSKSSLRRQRRRARSAASTIYLASIAASDDASTASGMYIGDSIEDVYDALDYIGMPMPAPIPVPARHIEHDRPYIKISWTPPPPDLTSAGTPDLFGKQCDDPAGVVLDHDTGVSDDISSTMTTHVPDGLIRHRVPDFIIRHYTGFGDDISAHSMSAVPTTTLYQSNQDQATWTPPPSDLTSTSTPDPISKHCDVQAGLAPVHEAGIGDDTSALLSMPAVHTATLYQSYQDKATWTRPPSDWTSACTPDPVGKPCDYQAGLALAHVASSCDDILTTVPTHVPDVFSRHSVPDFLIRHYLPEASKPDLIGKPDVSPISASTPDPIGIDASALHHLPSPWTAVLDFNRNRYYYWNQITDAVTWTRPCLLDSPYHDKDVVSSTPDPIDCDRSTTELVATSSQSYQDAFVLQSFGAAQEAAGAAPGAVMDPVRGGARDSRDSLSLSRVGASPGAVMDPVRGGARRSHALGSGDVAVGSPAFGSPAIGSRDVASGAAPGARRFPRRWQR